jgi:glycerophosphoryl diester phosphodiesterase
VARPIVIAHRGASAHRPEHTVAAYVLAIEHGADVIEPDLVITRDGVLVARNGNELSETTDVAAHPELRDRRTTKRIDGEERTGWFSEDLTLGELRTLRARERRPEVRPESAAHDGREPVPTFAEVVALAARAGVPVYPETKHPAYFRALGLALEEPLAADLRGTGVPAYLQSFDPDSLRRLAALLPDEIRIQLAGSRAGPRDLSPSGLRAIAAYAHGLGPARELVDARLVRDAHAAGLLVHPWAYRPEEDGAEAALREAFALGVDGVFADDPAQAVSAREAVELP